MQGTLGKEGWVGPRSQAGAWSGPFILGMQGCSMGILAEQGAQCRCEPTGTARRRGRSRPPSAFAPTNADNGGAGRASALAGGALWGGFFQRGDDPGQGLQVPFTLQGREQEVN